MRASVRLVGRVRVALVILAAALVCAGSASAASGWTEVTITASDATPLGCAYIVPSGSAPAGGRTGVILFHGLGQSPTDMEPYGSALAQFGFAALACDARGTGTSGGKFGLDGPRDVQDAQDLFHWFAARSDVSDTASEPSVSRSEAAKSGTRLLPAFRSRRSFRQSHERISRGASTPPGCRRSARSKGSPTRSRPPGGTPRSGCPVWRPLT